MSALRIVLATGNHPRHMHMLRTIASTGSLIGAVIERREQHVPAPPAGLLPATEALFVRHFENRSVSEARFFGDSRMEEDLEVCSVTLESLNSGATHEFLRRLNPTHLLSYGVHKLSAETLASFDGHAWNIHGGLSPRYRGVATHFWPSYFLEPQMTGMTLHVTTDAIDGGDLIHQTVAPLVAEDGIHDLACRAVSAFTSELPTLIDTLRSREPSFKHQKTAGRIWRVSDWRPEHLHPVYDLYGDRIVRHYLEGRFEAVDPRLHRQF